MNVMEFQPKTEQEIADSKLLKRGIYDFEIEAAAEKISKAGHPMFEVKLRLNGNGRVVIDYLLPELAEKFRNAAAACGLLDRYETGQLSETDWRGKRGKLKLGIEKAKNGYPVKNVVLDYLHHAVSSGSSFFGGNGAKAH